MTLINTAIDLAEEMGAHWQRLPKATVIQAEKPFKRTGFNLELDPFQITIVVRQRGQRTADPYLYVRNPHLVLPADQMTWAVVQYEITSPVNTQTIRDRSRAVGLEEACREELARLLEHMQTRPDYWVPYFKQVPRGNTDITGLYPGLLGLMGKPTAGVR